MNFVFFKDNIINIDYILYIVKNKKDIYENNIKKELYSLEYKFKDGKSIQEVFEKNTEVNKRLLDLKKILVNKKSAFIHFEGAIVSYEFIKLIRRVEKVLPGLEITIPVIEIIFVNGEKLQEAFDNEKKLLGRIKQISLQIKSKKVLTK